MTTFSLGVATYTYRLLGIFILPSHLCFLLLHDNEVSDIPELLHSSAEERTCLSGGKPWSPLEMNDSPDGEGHLPVLWGP